MGLLIEFVGSLVLIGLLLVALILWALRGQIRRLREEWSREGRVIEIQRQFEDERTECRAEAEREVQEVLCDAEAESPASRATGSGKPQEVQNRCD